MTNAIQRLRVRDLMTEEPIALKADDDLTRLYDLMDTQRIRHLPVVDDDGDLVGLVSHRDLVRSSLATGANELPVSEQRQLLRHARVGEIMTNEPETTTAETELLAAADVMIENKFGCLPVVEGSQLIGIITESDFVKFVVRQGREGA